MNRHTYCRSISPLKIGVVVIALMAAMAVCIVALGTSSDSEYENTVGNEFKCTMVDGTVATFKVTGTYSGDTPGKVTLISVDEMRGDRSVTIDNRVTDTRGASYHYNVTAIGHDAFNMSHVTHLRLPEHLASLDAGAFGWSVIDEFSIAKNSNFEVVNNILYEKEGDNRTLIRCGASHEGDNGVLVIGDNVTMISDYAFMECSKITKVTIGPNTKHVGDSAFSSSTIKSIHFGERVSHIGDSSLGSSVISEITVDQNNKKFFVEDGILYGRVDGDLRLIRCTSSVSGDLNIKDEVVYISTFSFCGCESITSITMGDRVRVVDDYSFTGCTGLKSIVFGPNVENIGNTAFVSEGLAVESITVPANDKWISDIPIFSDMRKLKEIIIPECDADLVTVDGVLFNKDMTVLYRYPSDKLGDTYNVPTTVMYIHSGAFNSNQNLKNLVLPDGLKHMGNYVFSESVSLQSVNIPENISVIPRYAFYGSDISSIVLPDNVTDIDYSAFGFCESLTEITLSQNLARIHSMAFAGCTKILSITIPKSLNSIQSSAFIGCNIQTIINHSSLFFTPGSNEHGGIALGAETIEQGNSFIRTVDGFKVSYNTEDRTYVLLAYEGVLRDVTVGNLTIDGVEYTPIAIGNGAFSENGSNNPIVSNVTIQDSVRSIGDSAFEYCLGLRSVTLPSGLVDIPNNCFQNCRSLESIEIPASVTSIQTGAFRLCWSLTEVTVPDNVAFIGTYAFFECIALEKLTLSEGLESIYNSAFEDCSSLKEVTIPSGVSELHSSLFRNCTSLLTVNLLSPNFGHMSAYVFSGCSSLSKVNIATEKNSILLTSNVFRGCSNSISFESIRDGYELKVFADVSKTDEVSSSELKSHIGVLVLDWSKESEGPDMMWVTVAIIGVLAAICVGAGVFIYTRRKE